MSTVFKLSVILVILILCFWCRYVDSESRHICYTKSTVANGIRGRIRKITCCPGYIADDAASKERLVCKPLCMPPCINAVCVKPNVCECISGYEANSTNPLICQPVCSSTVPFSHCVAPETVVCRPGYKLVNDTCKPVCTCEFGTCIAPEVCRCSHGYTPKKGNLCEPYCNRGCEHGTCAAPDMCICKDGWTISEHIENICVPICNITCENEICVAPNTCQKLEVSGIVNNTEGYNNFSDHTDSEYTAGTTEAESFLDDVYLIPTLRTIDDINNMSIEFKEAYSVTEMEREPSPSKVGSDKSSIWPWIISGLAILIILILLIMLIIKYQLLTMFGKKKTYDVEEIEARERKRSVRSEKTKRDDNEFI